MQHQFYVVFYNWENFGDDLFVRLLANRYPNICFHINGRPERLRAFENLPNICVHQDTLLCRILSKLTRMVAGKDVVYHMRVRRCEGIIHIGGSIYMEPAAEKKLRFFRERKDLYIKDKPYWVIGANFGPYSSKDFLAFFEEMFSQYTGISFRDNPSAQLFPGFSNISVAPDLVFSLRDYVQPKASANYVVFSLMERLLSEGESAYNAVKQEIANFINEGVNVILLSLCTGEGDLRFCERVKSEFPMSEAISILAYVGDNMDIVLNTIAQAQLVISMRFHGIVSALSMGIPVFPISYNIKTENMLRDVEFKGNWLPLNQVHTINHWKIKENMEMSSQCANIRLAAESYAHFKYVDQYLLGVEYGG